MPTCNWTIEKYGFFIFIPTFTVTLALVLSLSLFLTFKLVYIRRNLRGKEKNFRQATITTLYVSLLFILWYV